MVDRWLFTSWFELEVAHHDSIPNKTGFSILPGGFTQLPATFQHATLATDFSSYDWTLPEWVVKDVLQSRYDQFARYHSNPYFQIYWAAVETRFSQVVGPDCLVEMPDGTIFQQLVWGIMKSGWLLTLSVNGQGVLLLVAAAWRMTFPGKPLPVVWTMGDDMIMEWPANQSTESFIQCLNSFGVIVKSSTAAKEFAGFRFAPNKVQPCYEQKHEFIWCHTPGDELQELADAYSLLYSLSEEGFGEVVRDYQSLSPALLRSWALNLYDGELFGTPKPIQWASMLTEAY